MFRFTAALALLLFVSAGAWAQLMVRPPHPGPIRPAGVIQPPTLGFAGSLVPPSPTSPPRPLPRPFLSPNPFIDYFPYAPVWPVWYDSEPIVTTNYIPLAVPEPRPAPVSAPPPPPDYKARLTLNVPPGAFVTIGGKEVDSAASPVLLESPELREGQRYSFDVKVTWKERDKMQERSRRVVVDAGDTKSLTYTSQQ
jgi:uncharacterized protein (TIGR03000 family)